ncbi:MAG: GGDEF domain-containing protein, partial [Campylobacterales bacterium]
MTIKNKILSRMGLMILLVAMATIVIVTFHFRNYGIQAAKDKAAIISNLVKDGLTSHMVNGTMDKRDMFLANISHVKDIQNLWVVRGDLVNKQYGPPRSDELPRDAIDRKVLATGQKIVVLNETMDSATLRVTIPYVASANEVPKCISCHEANIGDTLGAISMEFDIMSIRTQGIRTIIYILLTTMVTLAIIIILTNRLLNPYLELFESLLESIKNATKGNFTFNVQTHLKDEAGDVAHWFNSLLGKLHDT